MYLHEDVKRIFVTGATGFLGLRVVAALLEQGMEVTAVAHPDQQAKLAALASRVRVVQGNLWNRGSLKGLSRGHHALVHLVGSLRADPARELTYQQINLVSARHAVGMAVSDGVPHFLLLSIAALPMMLPRNYILSKRDSEDYLHNSGLHAIVVRAPSLYVPTARKPLLRVTGALGFLPPTRWIIGRYMPLSVNVAARGIAATVQHAHEHQGRILYANDLRRLARQNAPRGALIVRPAIMRNDLDKLDETPFGWMPPKQK